MQKALTPYFAYGSNMNRTQMAHRCPGAEAIGRAFLAGYRFIINETGYATIVPHEADIVEGVLWEISSEHNDTLDEYEDHFEGSYDRCYREVSNVEGRKWMALVYIDHRQTRISPPNEGYLERVIEGARDHNLSEGYIETLKVFGEVE